MHIRQLTIFNVYVVYVTNTDLSKREVRLRSLWPDPEVIVQSKKRTNVWYINVSSDQTLKCFFLTTFIYFQLNNNSNIIYVITKSLKRESITSARSSLSAVPDDVRSGQSD